MSGDMQTAAAVARDVIAKRQANTPWNDLVRAHGMSRWKLQRLVEAEQAACAHVHNPLPHMERTGVTEEEARCATCPAFHARHAPHPTSGRSQVVTECRFNPIPVRKEPDDWCGRHPERQWTMRGAGDADRDQVNPEPADATSADAASER